VTGAANGALERLAETAVALMRVPGLSGHEDRVRRAVAAMLAGFGVASRTDRLGNLIATLPGAEGAPAVMLIAHLDQLGFVVRRIEPDGFLRLTRVGGVPEKALPGQPVLVAGAAGGLPGVIGLKAHHTTTPEENARVTPLAELFVDIGADSAEGARAMGAEIGAPVVYAPDPRRLGRWRLSGPSVDDRAGCAVLVEVARALAAGGPRPTVHLVFSVQEEFNLRGALPAAQALRPDICLQIDVTVAADTPDLAGWGEARLGGGPVMSHFSFHGRGTLNGLIPHPALTAHVAAVAARTGLALQRVASGGLLTETSYVQLVGEGVACLDLAFPARYTHGPGETCDLRDLEALARLIVETLRAIGPGFSLDRDAATGSPP
jgi:putative aminopeptidase FrvX